LDYFGDTISLSVCLEPSDVSGSSYHEVKYDTITREVITVYTVESFDRKIDPNEEFKKFIKDNRSTIQSGLGILTLKQQGLVKRFLDDLERKPRNGILGFL
jgi:hypothetical protein